MSTLQERIAEIMDTEGLSVGDIASIAGVSSSAVTQWKDGPTKTIKAAPATKLAERTGYGAMWIATGDGVKRPNKSLAAATPPGMPVYASSLRKIWVVGKGAGGNMPERVWNDGDYPVGATDQYADLGSSDPEAFLAEVIGQSMYPKFENKNFALIEPNTSIDIEDCVLVRLDNGQTLLKRLISRRNGLTLGSFNEPDLLHYDEFDVTWMYYAAHEVPRKKIKNRF